MIVKEGKYLIVHKIKNGQSVWELPIGGIKKNETEKKALKRELKEELGSFKFKLIKRVDIPFYYSFPKGFPFDKCEYYLWVVNFEGERIRLDPKVHDKHKWVEKEEIIQSLTYENEKKALKKALNFI